VRRKNDWDARFGVSRRAKDRATLAEAERAIEAEEAAALQRAADSAHAQWLEDEMREQLAFEAEKRRQLKRNAT
jgi:hypothetical protein